MLHLTRALKKPVLLVSSLNLHGILFLNISLPARLDFYCSIFAAVFWKYLLKKDMGFPVD